MLLLNLAEKMQKSLFDGALEQRMNGSCAGGTGAFIDQMAVLLKTDANGVNELAKNYQTIYPIASRCGFCQNGCSTFNQ